MKYRVHRLEAAPVSAQTTLEAFINQLTGDVLAVTAYIVPAFRGYGATSRVAFLLIVEKIV